jgi:hypothetical protein
MSQPSANMDKHERLIRPIREILLPLLVLLAFATCVSLIRFAFATLVHARSGKSGKPADTRIEPR